MINWGIADQGGFRAALQTGLQLGSVARQRDQQNALMEQRQQSLDLADEKFTAEQAEKQQAVMAQRQIQTDTAAAMQGDPEAKQRLLQTSFKRWQEIDKADKAKLAETQADNGQFATYALSLRDPRAMRQAVIDYGTSKGDETAIKLAQLPDDQMVAALRTNVFEAEMVNDLIRMEQPRFQAIPEGGTLVDTRNPQAVRQFQQGGQQYSEGQTATNPQTGERLILRNGQWEPM